MTSTKIGDVLRVVLFAEGVGSDPSLYRPASDTTQWWNRRDALVRCVAAFLFGPSGNGVDDDNNNQDVMSQSQELVILFDQDLTMLQMTYSRSNDGEKRSTVLVPSECTIIALWKRAAKHPGQLVEDRNLSCRLVPSSTCSEGQLLGAGSFAPSSISATSSKREILSYLQSVCSVDFLREHRLNSSIDVVARKANKNALLGIWSKWKSKEIVADNNSNTAGYSAVLDLILQKLLLSAGNGTQQQVIAGTLHESSEHELPCWDEDLNDDWLKETSSSSSVAASTLVLFLGAVRDMTTVENQALKRVCSQCSSHVHGGRIPLLQIRLGPVAEFTSKILSVVGFHHHHGRLIPSVLQMLRKDQMSGNKIPLIDAEASVSNVSPLLHFVCFLPISSNEISTNMDNRSSTLWSMVRCTVSCLWRSRLASGSRCAASIGALRNRLTFLFADGAILTLNQDEFVVSMAEQHLAAPSEYQILSALQQKAAHSLIRLKSVDHANINASSDFNWKTTSKATVRLLLQEKKRGDPTKCSTENGAMVALDFVDSATSAHDRHIFYNRYDQSANRDSSVASPTFILLAIASTQNKEDELDRRRILLVRALQKKRVPVLHGRSLLNVEFRCIDQLASIITMLQHLCYQGRLFGLLSHIKKQCSRRQLPNKRKSEEAAS